MDVKTDSDNVKIIEPDINVGNLVNDALKIADQLDKSHEV